MVHADNTFFTAVFEQTYFATSGRSALIFKTRKDAENYKIGRGLGNVKIVRISLDIGFTPTDKSKINTDN